MTYNFLLFACRFIYLVLHSVVFWHRSLLNTRLEVIGSSHWFFAMLLLTLKSLTRLLRHQRMSVGYFWMQV